MAYGRSAWLCILFIGTLWIIVFASEHDSPAQDALKQGKRVMRLTLDEGKRMVLQKNLDISIRQLSPRIEGERIMREQGAFDPVVSGSVIREDATTPLSTRSSVAAAGRTTVESEAYTTTAALAGKIDTGTRYSLELQDVRTENTFNNFDAEYDSSAELKITHPLLKDSGREVNRFPIVIARKNRDISLNEFRQIVIDTMTELKKAYWDIVLARDDLKVKQESLKLAESLLDLNRKRLRAEVAAPLEVLQSEAGVASRKEELITAEKTLRERENALKKLITADAAALRDVEIVPLDVPLQDAVRINLQESFAEALARRPDYQKAKLDIEKNNLTIRYAENQKLPAIDLEASYGYNGLGSSLGDSMDDLGHNPEWTIGLTMKLPLSNRAARGDLNIARYESQQKLLQMKKLEQEIFIAIDNVILDIEAQQQRISAARASKALAQETLAAEEKKLQQGLSTSHDVLQFQEELAAAQSREIGAIIDYNKALAVLARTKGTVLEEERIKISEGDASLMEQEVSQ